MVPSESEEPAELKATTSGARPPVGVALATGTGARLTGPTLIETAFTSVAPSLSVTVRVAEYVPGVA